MMHKITLVALLLMVIGCSSSKIGGNGNNGKLKKDNVVNQELRGLHYEAHKNRLTFIFELDNDAEAMQILNANRSLLESQSLTPKNFAALIRIYAKACEEVSTDQINIGMGYQDIHAAITGITLSNQESQKIQSTIESLYTQEDNAQDLSAFAACLQASTSKDALLLNVVVNTGEGEDS